MMRAAHQDRHRHNAPVRPLLDRSPSRNESPPGPLHVDLDGEVECPAAELHHRFIPLGRATTTIAEPPAPGRTPQKRLGPLGRAPQKRLGPPAPSGAPPRKPSWSTTGSCPSSLWSSPQSRVCVARDNAPNETHSIEGLAPMILKASSKRFRRRASACRRHSTARRALFSVG